MRFSIVVDEEAVIAASLGAAHKHLSAPDDTRDEFDISDHLRDAELNDAVVRRQDEMEVRKQYASEV